MKTKAELDVWAQPQDVNQVVMVLGGEMGRLLPPYAEIPDEFKRGNGKWNKFQRDWFFGGLASENLIPGEGIDKRAALRHLGAIQGSFEPKHEHKEAAVAYLASKWFTDKSTWQVKARAK